VNLKSNPRVFDNKKIILAFHSWDLFSNVGFCILVKFHTKKNLMTTHKMGMCRRKLESNTIRKKRQLNKAKKNEPNDVDKQMVMKMYKKRMLTNKTK
jgi:hypothetical protein